ncbi:serine hydrolase [Novosphingobium sp. 11B]
MKRRCQILFAVSWAVFGYASVLAQPEGRINETESIYRRRFADMMANGGIMTSYAPMEAVAGAKRPIPLPEAADKEHRIKTAALDQAAAYARASNARAFMVWRDGKVERAEYYKGGDRNTPIVSKSLSKPLGAIAIGRAIAMGKIASVDQPVADFIAEWRGTPKAAILIRHLLDMRAGLMEQDYSPDPNHPLNRAYLDPDHGRYIIDYYPLTHKPGSYYGYSNATAELVALVIERATGLRYGTFLSQEVLVPIGAMGGQIWVNRPGGLAHSGCCMTLPAETYLRLAILLMDDGIVGRRRLLPKNYVAEMAKGTAQNPYYGMGVWVAGTYVNRRGFGAVGKPGPRVLHSEPYLDKNLFLFDGNSSQVVYISRATRTIILRLGDTAPAKPEWDNSKLPNIVLRGLIRQTREHAPEVQAR